MYMFVFHSHAFEVSLTSLIQSESMVESGAWLCSGWTFERLFCLLNATFPILQFHTHWLMTISRNINSLWHSVMCVAGNRMNCKRFSICDDMANVCVWAECTVNMNFLYKTISQYIIYIGQTLHKIPFQLIFHTLCFRLSNIPAAYCQQQ